jgi:L-ascorbate metabolism protein UlaG (beta-lactamase superfamily)
MKVNWYGHACFLFEGQGIRLVTDPPAREVGYQLPESEVDLVTVSHGHHDHDNVNALRGVPAVINTPGVHDVKGLRVEGFPTFHDDARGAQRGPNLVFAWEMDGVRVCHLGDLGHVLDAKTLQGLGRIDLLLIPVGGIFTVDADGAKQVVDQINPRLVIPMHYKTPVLSFKLGGVDDFVRLFQPGQVRRRARSADAPAGAAAPAGAVLQVEGANLPSALEVVVLDYFGG